MTAAPVTVSTEGDIAIVTVDNPPVNALNQAVRQGLLDAVAEVVAGAARAAVLRCAGRTFIAGADIREFDAGPFTPHLVDVVAAIEKSPKPWVAAIHGTALGGGLEVALGCHYRIADAGAKLGLPEVALGLIPGAGGTQRLPRLTGAAEAVSMITSGKPVGADKARAIGLVDRVATGDLLAEARAFAADVAGETPPMMDRNPIRPAPGAVEWAAMQTAVEKRAKGQTSPLAGLEAVRRAYKLDLDAGLAAERDSFLALKESDQSRALRHAFFAERAAAKPPVLAGVAPREVTRVAVVGGGLMGAGIATSLLTAGLQVAMIETDEAAAEAGRGRVAANLESAVRRGRMDPARRDALLAAFETGADYALATGADLAIEAVFEDLDVKRAVFAKLAGAMGAQAILATNTSYLDPNRIAEGLEAPERVVGMHFFSPAHIMRLVEVVRADETAPEVLATAFALAKRMGKVAALSGVCEGFIGNRILAAYRRVAEYMAEDMRAIEPVDAAMRGFGLPMGPFQLMDLAGLQIGYATRRRLDATRDPAQRYASTVADRLVEAGHTGQKTGAGFYRYEAGARKPLPHAFADEALKAAAAGRPERTYAADEIMARALAAMVNEGAHILAEGVAARPLEIDVVKLYGYGFPRWRGGPMMAADLFGVDKLLAVMEEVAATDPGSWRIAPLFREAAVNGGFEGLNG